MLPLLCMINEIRPEGSRFRPVRSPLLPTSGLPCYGGAETKKRRLCAKMGRGICPGPGIKPVRRTLNVVSGIQWSGLMSPALNPIPVYCLVITPIIPLVLKQKRIPALSTSTLPSTNMGLASRYPDAEGYGPWGTARRRDQCARRSPICSCRWIRRCRDRNALRLEPRGPWVEGRTFPSVAD